MAGKTSTQASNNMKRTKFKQRIDNAVNAFFDDEPQDLGENGLSFARSFALLKPEPAAQFNEKGDRLMKILKRTFLFLPGAFYLFFSVLMIFSFEFFWDKPFGILAAFLIGSFMTIFGLGSLKNPKHLVIPLSIVAVGIAAFSLFSMFGGIKYVFAYGIYFFPFALIAPFLAKSLVDSQR